MYFNGRIGASQAVDVGKEIINHLHFLSEISYTATRQPLTPSESISLQLPVLVISVSRAAGLLAISAYLPDYN